MENPTSIKQEFENLLKILNLKVTVQLFWVFHKSEINPSSHIKKQLLVSLETPDGGCFHSIHTFSFKTFKGIYGGGGSFCFVLLIFY